MVWYPNNNDLDQWSIVNVYQWHPLYELVESLRFLDSTSNSLNITLFATDTIAFSTSASTTTDKLAFWYPEYEQFFIGENQWYPFSQVLNEAISDVLALTETTSESLTAAPAITDDITLTETTSELLTASPVITDNITLTETISEALTASPTSLDDITFAETTSESLTGSSTSLDDITLTETISESMTASLTLLDNILFDDSTFSPIVYNNAIIDDITFNDFYRKIFDEQFESIGYDEDNWNENIQAGSSIDNDADTADVSSPSNWNSQCCKFVLDNESYIYNSVGAEPITYWRVEFVITEENLSNSTYINIALGYEDSTIDIPWIFSLYKNGSGDLQFYFISSHDGLYNDYYGFDTPTLNTRYSLEVKWDATNESWAWKINGVNQPNDQDSSNPVTTEGNLTDSYPTDAGLIILGSLENTSATYYIDLVACNDITWVGDEPTSPTDFYLSMFPLTTDDVTLTETTSESLTGSSTTTDNITLTETISESMTANINVNNTINFADITYSGFFLIVSDDITFAETTSESLTGSSTSLDDITLAEETDRVLTISPATTDDITLTETTSESLTASPVITDTLTLSDTIIGNLTLNPSGSDIINFTETAIKSLTLNINSNDNINFNDISLLSFHLLAVDNVEFIDTTSVNVTASAVSLDSLNLSDNTLSDIILALLSATDNIRFSDNISELLTKLKTISVLFFNITSPDLKTKLNSNINLELNSNNTKINNITSNLSFEINSYILEAKEEKIDMNIEINNDNIYVKINNEIIKLNNTSENIKIDNTSEKLFYKSNFYKIIGD